MHYAIFSIFLIISFIYLSTLRSFIIVEKILYSLILCLFSLLTSSVFTEWLLVKIYGGDYEMYLSNSIANLIFYSIGNCFLIIVVLLIRKVKSLDEYE